MKLLANRAARESHSQRSNPGPNLRHRIDAVNRLLRGEPPQVIADEMGVTPKVVEQWAREFCRAGETRLRQLPDNWFESCLTGSEKLVPFATLVSVLLAVTLFIQGQRKESAERARATAVEREVRVRDAYTSLDDKYLDYVKLCLDHPDLDVFDTPIVRSRPATPEQQREENMVLSMLMSILERSFLMYSNPTDSFERSQWNAWSAYMKAWCVRDNFRAAWSGSRDEFDASFGGYMDQLMAGAPATRPGPGRS